MFYSRQKSLITRLALILTLLGGMFGSALIQSVFAATLPHRNPYDFAIFGDNATISPGETVRVSVDSNGGQGDNASLLPALSADGRYVAFYSVAENLVNNDSNGAEDIYVYDLQTGIPIRVSVDSSGAQSDGGSAFQSISADGRYVAFASLATNLVPGDSNGMSDIFVHDMQTGMTMRVSVDSSGGQANNNSSYQTSISGDGRYVAFISSATNLVTDDTNGLDDIFVHDMQTGVTTRVPVGSNPALANFVLDYQSISANGRYIVFNSNATDLVPDDTNGATDIFLHDLQTGVTSRVSVDSSGTEANGQSSVPFVSADGRYVLFSSSAINLVPGDTNGTNDIFVHDTQTGATARVSLDSNGGQSNGNSYNASISADGRYVTFYSSATNLVPGDTNAKNDVFIHDMQTGETTRISVTSTGGQANGNSQYPSISADGSLVAFTSWSANLVAGDTNLVPDVFVHRQEILPIPTPANTSIFTPTNGPTVTPTTSATPTYTPTPIRYTISGYVGISWATITYIENGMTKTITSNSTGNYIIQVPAGWSGTITPSKTNVIFNPTSRTYTNVQSNLYLQTYLATIIVMNSNDSGPDSLRQAIADSISGVRIRFDPALAGQTITLASELSIYRNLTIDGSGLEPPISISGNHATRIFNIQTPYSLNLWSLVLKDGIMNGTSDNMSGGAIYTNSYGILSIRDVAFIGNTAYKAGAIYGRDLTQITILDSEFISNSAQSEGGAIFKNGQGMLTIQGSLFTNNIAAWNGGAIKMDQSSERLLENNTFLNNSAGSGGAIMVFQNNSLNATIRKNLFTGNTATTSDRGGGAIDIYSSGPQSILIENNTFYDNHAIGSGGAILSEGNTILKNNTFSNNQASSDGGSLKLYAPSSTELYNNIFANNAGGGECAMFGTNYRIGSHNLVEDGSPACLPMLSSDPILGPIADNGGLTQTMALLPGSPAIDSGDNASCLSIDQRDVARPQGNGCDIGAYEYDGPILPTYTPTNTPTPTNTFTPTATPSYSYYPLYLSFTSSQTIGGVSSSDEDIWKFDGQTWSLHFDGSDVGVGSPDLFGFSIVDADTILMSFSSAVMVSGIPVTPQDVVRFEATSLGINTAGTFYMYLDGSDVGLDASGESIDSVSLLSDGRVLLSTTSSPSVPGVSGKDEDVLAFTPTSLGDVTAGTWAMYFDGSDVGLAESSNEDVDALDVTSDGYIYLSTLGDFSVPGVSGFDEDVFICIPTSIGDVTACNYLPTLYFDGSTWGLSGNDVDAFNFRTSGPVPTPTLSLTPTTTLIPTHTPTQTPSPTVTSTPTATFTPTATKTSTPTSTSTVGPSPTPTYTATSTAITTATFTSTNTATPLSTNTSTSTATPTATFTLVPPTATDTSIPSTATATPSGSDLFNDGFESGDFSAWSAAITGGDGVAVVQNTVVHTGSFAVKLSETANTGSVAYSRKSLLAPETNLTISGDFMLTQEGVSGGNVPIFRLFDASTTRLLTIYRQNATNGQIWSYDGTTRNQASSLMPLNTWVHFEVHVITNGTGASTIEVYMNGALVIQTTTANLGTAGVLTMQIGNDTSKQVFTLYIDDIKMQH